MNHFLQRIISNLFKYYRHFEVKNKDDVTEAAKLFSVPDFVGDACKAIASRVRGSIASVRFDDFHKVSILDTNANNSKLCIAKYL